MIKKELEPYLESWDPVNERCLIANMKWNEKKALRIAVIYGKARKC